MAMAQAGAAGRVRIGDREVNRLGYGAMRITGDGIWGPPTDIHGAKQLLHRALDLGVELIDTADSYGPEVSEQLIAEALHPYPDQVLIATKAGMQRPGPGQWTVNAHPDHLREACDGSLQRLKVDQIDLYQLHRIDEDVPLAEQIGALTELQEQGKVRHLGLSEVSVDQLDAVSELAAVVSVQNHYNLADRTYDEVVTTCEQRGIAFLPFFPLQAGKAASGVGPVADIAETHGVEPTQIALAWLLARSPAIAPIPGTSSSDHLEDNVAAASVELSDDERERLDAAHA